MSGATKTRNKKKIEDYRYPGTTVTGEKRESNSVKEKTDGKGYLYS